MTTALELLSFFFVSSSVVSLHSQAGSLALRYRRSLVIHKKGSLVRREQHLEIHALDVVIRRKCGTARIILQPHQRPSFDETNNSCVCTRIILIRGFFCKETVIAVANDTQPNQATITRPGFSVTAREGSM